MNDGFMRLVNLVAKFVFALFEVIRIIILFLVVLSVIRIFVVYSKEQAFFLIIRMWIFIYIREIVFEKQPMISAIFFSYFSSSNNWSTYNFFNILCAMKI